MARVLSELLAADEPLFASTIEELESSSGLPGVDMHLASEIANKVHIKTRELGLDPLDTTGKELYHGLQALIKQHDEFLVQALGAKDPTDAEDLLPRLVDVASHMPIPKQCWVLRHSVAKRLLKEMPPKKVMKQLGYRSVESLIKRESTDELFAALRVVESTAWLERFIKTYKKLQPSDFEIRSINFVDISLERWGQPVTDYVNRKRHNIVHLKELGVIGVLPLPVKHLRGICITILPLLLYYINEIRLYSAFFKLQQVKPDFDRLIIDTLLIDAKPVASLAGQPLHWRVLQRFYGQADKSLHPEIFEPHLQPEDLQWRRAEEILYRIEPALKFWENMDYVGAIFDGDAVSFNLVDNAISYCNDLPYQQRANHHFRSSLWNELFTRYLQQKSLEDQVLGQIDSEMIESETSTPNKKRPN